MAQTRELAACIEAYADWRRKLAQSISALHAWIKRAELGDDGVDLAIDPLFERLSQDKLVIAFVAAASRGKSELINAMFFPEFGAPLLPTAAGPTTLSPTELVYDSGRSPSIRVLPIETRLRDLSVHELRNHADEWVTFPLNVADPVKMKEALARLSQTKRVSAPLARALGLQDDPGGENAAAGGRGGVDVPCWRHAIINFPHPMLRHGVVIVDAPGANIVGADPELATNLLPNAHLVVFVLAADSGATESDLEVWTRDLSSAGQKAERIVVLNKIDTFWDDRKPESQVTTEIDRQMAVCASLLGLSRSQIHPVSARKGMLAKIDGDNAALEKSRLPAFEQAFCRKLLAAKREALGAAVRADIAPVAARASSALEVRQARAQEQLDELRELRAKNEDVIRHMLDRVREEKGVYEQGAQRFTALRTVFAQQTNGLFDVLGLEALRANAGRTRQAIERSTFTRGVRNAMADFFGALRRDFDDAERRSTEIHDMMQAMYTRFASEQGIEPFDPPPFEMLKYRREIDRIENAYHEHFNTVWNMLSNAKFSLTQRFFETVTSRVKHVYDIANYDIEIWLRAVMSPLETRLAERHLQHKRRLESVKRIHIASSEIDEHIVEIEQQQKTIAAQLTALKHLCAAIDIIALQSDAAPVVVNA